MTQTERRVFLIKELLAEQSQYAELSIPENEQKQKDLLRSLMNVRLPKQSSKDFQKIQDEYLQERVKEKGIVYVNELTPVFSDLYLWRGDITALACGAIVNAANSGMTGCYCPCHGCIDNAIHTYAGVQLRLECANLMKEQGYDEPTGKAKITKAYNLPSKFILHTVGPIVQDGLSKKHREQLVSCYRSCLELADAYELDSVAFCCISTGEFHFPNGEAAKIAVQTVLSYKEEKNSKAKVIFNVFKQNDYEIYRYLLGEYKKAEGGI